MSCLFFRLQHGEPKTPEANPVKPQSGIIDDGDKVRKSSSKCSRVIFHWGCLENLTNWVCKLPIGEQKQVNTYRTRLIYLTLWKKNKSIGGKKEQ
jgi:hypothetical protein